MLLLGQLNVSSPMHSNLRTGRGLALDWECGVGILAIIERATALRLVSLAPERS